MLSHLLLTVNLPKSVSWVSNLRQFNLKAHSFSGCLFMLSVWAGGVTRECELLHGCLVACEFCIVFSEKRMCSLCYLLVGGTVEVQLLESE